MNKYWQDYYQKHKEKILAKQRQVSKTPLYKEKRRRYYQLHKKMFYKATSTYKKKQRILIKTEVLTHYGNGRLACVRCGFTDIRALCIDHINGGGNKKRKLIGSSMLGRNIYAWLKKKAFPVGYQTLCHNCNWIKRFENNEDSRGITL
jgi:hypothetical protein